jgi:hypothetical protein
MGFYLIFKKDMARWPKGSPKGGEFKSLNGGGSNSTMPSSIDHWTRIPNTQGGSNLGFQAHDDKGGKHYIKFPSTDDHVYNEILASKLYKAAGIRVPELTPVTYKGRLAVDSKWTSGLENKGKYIKHVEGAKEGFAVDAWLGNWDTAGLGHDNLLQHPDGKAFRVDAGGSLKYRAQGDAKGDKFGPTVPEIDRMRDPMKSRNAAQVFGSMSDADVAKSVKKVADISEETIDKLVNEHYTVGSKERKQMAETLKARRKYLIDRFLKP